MSNSDGDNGGQQQGWRPNDDLLSSMRKVIGAEGGPLPLGAPKVPGDPAKATQGAGSARSGEPAGTGDTASGHRPLSLTPEMRSTPGDVVEDVRDLGDGDLVEIDEEALEDMIRSVVRDELDLLVSEADGDAGALGDFVRAELASALAEAGGPAVGDRDAAPDEVLRSLIRAELADAPRTMPAGIDEERAIELIAEALAEVQAADAVAVGGADPAVLTAAVSEAVNAAMPDEEGLRTLIAEVVAETAPVAATATAAGDRDVAGIVRAELAGLIDAGAFDERMRELIADEVPAPAETGAGAAEVRPIDEDRIREVLRADLAGEMGQAISRNVMRLVRDELSRQGGSG